MQIRSMVLTEPLCEQKKSKPPEGYCAEVVASRPGERSGVLISLQQKGGAE